jgi:hypothetical protein
MRTSLRFDRVGLLVAASLAATGAAPRVVVRGTGADLEGESPVVVELATHPSPGAYALKPQGEAGRTLPADVFEDGGKVYLALVLGPLKAGESRIYSLVDAEKGESHPAVDLGKDGPNVPVLLRGRPFTEHRTDAATKPILYPVLGPTGEPFTRSFPLKQVEGEDRDHNHQRSFWFTHGKVNGFDFWSSDPLNRPSPIFGTIKETSRTIPVRGEAIGVLRTTDDWLGPDGKRVCSDERVHRFYNTADVRVIDVDVTIKATDGPVTFGDTKEGMFGLRVASSMDVKRKQGGKIVNAEGLADGDAWGKASPWVDYTGPVAGKTVGIAILNHPSSFRYPTTWHVRDYGLFAANPFGWHDFGRKESGEYTIPKGESIAFRYRVILHEGDAASARVASAFRAYAEPPKVEVQAE